MRRRTALLASLAIGLVLSTSGCARRAADPSSLKLLRAAGDRASLTVVVQPARFGAAVKTLGPLLHHIREPGVQEVLSADDLWSAARALMEAIPIPTKPTLPVSLPGWDQTRPIVAALFEPQVGDLVLAARSVLPMSMRQILDAGLPGVRHRVLVPATDPKALTQAVAQVLGQVGLKAYVAEQADPGLRGGFLFLTPGHDGFAALIPEADHLRIELLTDDHTPAEDDAGRIKAWSDLLAQPVHAAATGAASPALRLAAASDHFAAFHVRPWQLRDLGSQIGTTQVVEAIAHASADYRMQLLAAGLAAVANGYLMMDRERPEFDDLCVAWDLSGGLRTTAVVSLTEHGAKVFQAGLEQGRPPPAPKSESLAWAWSRLDWNAMLQTAGTLPSLSQAKKPQEVMRALAECGPFCSLHFLTTSPFGAARTAIDFAPMDLSNKLPRGFSLALVGLDPKANFAVRAEAAARFPAGFNTRAIREGLQEITRHAPLARDLALHTESVAGDELISLTLGLQPGEGLAGEVEADGGLLGEARVDLKKLIALFGPIGLDRQPEWAKALGLLGTWRSRSHLVERALVGESLLSIGQTDRELAWIDPDAFGGQAWDAGAPGPPSKGERCLQQVTRAMMEAFRALAAAAPEMRNLMLAKAMQETDAPLACALGEADTAERAKRTQLMVHLFLADRMAEDFMDEREQLVLGKACKLGHAEACIRAEAIGSRPQITLVEVKGSCGPGAGWGQPAMRIKSAADAEAQIADLTAEPGAPEPNLAADAGAQWSVVAGALEALAAKGIDRTGLVVRDPDGGVRTIEVARPGAKPRVDPYGGPRFARLEAPGARRQEIALLVEAKKVLLMDGRGTYTLDHRPDCKPGEVCADLEILGSEIDRLSGDLASDAAIRVQIEPGVPFRDAAAVLGRISCAEPKRRWGGGRAREIVIGPLPSGSVDRAGARKLTAKQAEKMGILGVLRSGDEASSFGSGLDDAALGGLMGAEIGGGGLGTRGSGGLGSLEGVGKGGGGLGTRGLGLAKGGAPGPRIKTGRPEIRGSLSREIIRRIIRRQFAQVRYCYEKQLVHDPNLHGKVVVRFVIGPTGIVQSAAVSATTLKDAKVESCLVSVFKRMRFPSPKGGGIVIANYPFMFTSDGAAESGQDLRGPDGKRLAIGKLNTDGTSTGGVGIGGPGTDKGNTRVKSRVKTGKPTILGSMSKEIIRRYMRRHRARFRHCYEKELVRDPKLAGKVVLKFVISATGTVQSAEIAETTLKSKPVETCLLKTVKRIRFPSAKGGGIVIVSYPLTFDSFDAEKDGQ